jgi:hypothetical protein
MIKELLLLLLLLQEERLGGAGLEARALQALSRLSRHRLKRFQGKDWLMGGKSVEWRSGEE